MTCHITGIVVTPDGSSAANRMITFRKEDFTLSAQGTLSILPEYVTTFTNSSGNVSFYLLPGTYSGFYVGSPEGRSPFRIKVPSNTANADFSSLIVASSIPEDPALTNLVFEAYSAIKSLGAITVYPPTASQLIEVATTANSKVVTLAQVLGSGYTQEQDAAAILNNVAIGLATAGIRIVDRSGLAISFKTQFNLVDNFEVDFGWATIWRDWSATGSASAMITHANYATGYISNVKFYGGIIRYRDSSIQGIVFKVDINNAWFEGISGNNYRKGQFMLFGGDDFVIRNCEAFTGDTGTGDGAFRCLNGTRITVAGCRAICNDDCFQFVVSTGAPVGSYRFGKSITYSQYVGCHGVSYKARLCIAGIIDQPDETFVSTPSRLKGLTFSSMKGTAPGGFIVACNAGDGTIDQADDIHFTDVNIEASSETTFSGNTASQIYGTAAYPRTIGRVSFSNVTVEGSTKSYGLDVYNAAGARITVHGSSWTGQTNAMRIRCDDATARIYGGSLVTTEGGLTDKQPLLVSTTGTNCKVFVEGTLFKGVPTGMPGIQLAGVGSTAFVTAMKVERASGATDVRAVQGASGTTIIYNPEGLSGDIDNPTFGASTVKARLISPWALTIGSVVINDTTNSAWTVSQLAETVIEDSQPTADRIHSISTVNAVKGMRIHWYRNKASAGAIVVAQSGGGATLATLTTIGQFVDLIFDGTNWVVETSAGSGGGGPASWGSITGTLSSQTDLQTALNGKASSSHTHAWSDITSGIPASITALSGTNTGDQTITLTGAITGTGTGSFATTLAAGAVALSNMANVASGSLFYRKTAGSGAPEVQTLATLKTDLALATVATSGLFADLGSKPTTLAGYGITNAALKATTATRGQVVAMNLGIY